MGNSASISLSSIQINPIFENNQLSINLTLATVVANNGTGDGTDGLSAYEIWLGLGNTGTEQDFIDSLKGIDGTDGVDGSNANTNPIGVSFNTAIDLSNFNAVTQGQLTDNSQFTLLSTGLSSGNALVATIDANGYTPTFSSDFNAIDASPMEDWSTVSGQLNTIIFQMIGSRCYYKVLPSYTGVLSGIASISESMVMTDVFSALINPAAALAEIMTMTDSYSNTLISINSIIESMGMSDSQSAIILSNAGQILESFIMTDLITANMLTNGGDSETALMTDTFSASIITALTIASGTTSTDGTYLDLTGNKNIASGSSGIILKVGGVSKTFTYSVVSNKLRITPTVAFLSTDVITIDYTPGDVTASDNAVMATFIDFGITNTVVSGGTGILEFIDFSTINGGAIAAHIITANAGTGYNCQCLSDRYLEAGQDGYIQYEVLTANDSRNDKLIFDESNSLPPLDAVSGCNYGVLQDGFATAKGALNSTTGSQVSWTTTVNGSTFLRLVRASGNLKAQWTTNAGSIWHDVYDFGTHTGRLYIKGLLTTGKKMSNVKGFNLNIP